MNDTAADLNSAIGTAPDVGRPTPKPYDQELVTLTKREHIELKQRASSYKDLHARAVARIEYVERRHQAEKARFAQCEAELRAALEAAQAQIRDLRQRVFGAKTEQSRSVNAACSVSAGPPRPRGQQRGRRGHGRTRADALPARVEEVTLQAQCPRCGLGLGAFPGTQDAEILEIEVKAYRRVIHRHRYRPLCRCGCLPGIVTAPPAAQLIARGKLGVSIWVEALLSKFLYGQPSHRLLQDWDDQGLHVAQGTLTEGLRKLLPMLGPVAEAGLDELRRGSHWHADETRWEVFEERQGKVGHRWYLWVFQSATAVCFVLDPSRSATVPAAALKGVEAGILSVDRYASYHKFARLNPGVKLSICWAHQRRDFLRVAGDHPALWGWAMGWVGLIGELYALHARRRQQWADGDATFKDSDAQTRALVASMEQRCLDELADTALAGAAHKVLRTLRTYWAGLILFLDHPAIDLDNNAAERALRPAVVGRKNYYGSGRQWSGQLAATMMSILGTLRCWGINPRTWLSEYLHVCAHAGGHAPPDLDRFVPWRMDEEWLSAMRGTALATMDRS